MWSRRFLRRRAGPRAWHGPEGSLWVGQYQARRIHQIDPETGSILRSIETSRYVTWVRLDRFFSEQEAAAADIFSRRQVLAALQGEVVVVRGAAQGELSKAPPTRKTAPANLWRLTFLTTPFFSILSFTDAGERPTSYAFSARDASSVTILLRERIMSR